MTKVWIRIGASLVLLGAASTAAAKPLVLEPTSAWTVDYGEEKCSLLRDFGPLDKGLGLRIDSYGSPSSFQVSVIGDRVPRPQLKIPVTQIGFAFSADKELRKDVPALTGTIGDYRFVQFGMAFRPVDAAEAERVPVRKLDDSTLAERAVPRLPDPEFEASVNSLLFELRRGQELQLNTGPMAPALKALRTCVEDLQKSWGLDPAEQKSVTRLAFPAAEAVKEVMDDFPRDMAFRGINGFVPLRVIVEPSGAGTECVVQLADAPEEFRKTACANIGTQFNPALGADGQPVRSVYQTSVVYLVRPF